MPTIELIERTVEHEFIARDRPKPYVFHGKNVTGSVSSAIIRHFKRGDELDGTITFTTHQVMPRLRYLAEREKIHVLVDEEMQVHACNEYQVPKTHYLLTDHLELSEHNSIYSRLTVADDEAIEEIAKNKRKDVVYEEFRDLAQLLDNEHWELFVNTELYDKLHDGGHKKLTVHSVMNPSVLDGFASVTIASALLQDSMLFRLWQTMGVEFVADDEITKKLRFTEHKNGHLITTKYGTDADWSKNKRKAIIEGENTTPFDEMVKASEAEFGEKPFVFQMNRDNGELPFGANGQQIPNMPHGLNDYSTVDNIVFLSSLNPSPAHFRFMELMLGDFR